MLLLASGSRGTEGVSREGLEELLNQVRGTIVDDAANNLKDYGSFVETLRDYWQGADADQWIVNFENLAQEIADSLESYYGQIEAEFNKVFASWEEFQAGHVSQG